MIFSCIHRPIVQRLKPDVTKIKKRIKLFSLPMVVFGPWPEQVTVSSADICDLEYLQSADHDFLWQIRSPNASFKQSIP